jgi:hypothetical protein
MHIGRSPRRRQPHHANQHQIGDQAKGHAERAINQLRQEADHNEGQQSLHEFDGKIGQCRHAGQNPWLMFCMTDPFRPPAAALPH